MYTTQPFIPWLKKFLGQEGIEDQLAESVTASKNYSDKAVRDIWDGDVLRMFQDLNNNLFVKTSGNLSFGIYVDWFNPFGNKIMGKKHSVGAIVLFCLSLPPHI
ncbi:hypothetical protein CROQUDRAFT_701978 [Cronartium quercuum f. sp. fusiforme G11]|uniref:Uncharacterized protein n=1 Tax=Cronartium quercuum f. sp. fusiforme G11 TaxID=708437 RepID=A0A9P6NIQ1_9BASI|nr:hypothetical protein CROQUDRAFT_701978 [Cronartium quercuum f. sp. fusiforme G11]